MAEALKLIGDLPRLTPGTRFYKDQECQFSPDGKLLFVWQSYQRSEEPAGQVVLCETGECLSMISPRMDPEKLQQHWMLYEVAWEETGLPRLALWWRFEGSETYGEEEERRFTLDQSVIQVVDARRGEHLWATEAAGPRQSFSYARHLHLFGDTLRIIDGDFTLQVHRSGLMSYREHGDLEEVTLAEGSGELLRYTAPPPVEGLVPFVSPSGRHVIFDSRLYQITDRPRDPVALPSICFPTARRMNPGSQELGPEQVPGGMNLPDPDAPPTDGVLPDWMSVAAKEQPGDASNVQAPLTCTLDDVRSALMVQGWPISGAEAWRTACQRPHSLVVAEALQRPEGVQVFMTAWRNFWPVRWKVQLQGNAEEAAGQITRALLTGHDRLTEVPVAQQDTQGPDQTVFSYRFQFLRDFQKTAHGDDAALASIALSRYLRDMSSVLTALPPPPEPDWNLVRLCWYEHSLPLWVLRQLWTWMPANVRAELREDLEARDHELDQEFAAWLSNECAQEPSGVQSQK